MSVQPSDSSIAGAFSPKQNIYIGSPSSVPGSPLPPQNNSFNKTKKLLAISLIAVVLLTMAIAVPLSRRSNESSASTLSSSESSTQTTSSEVSETTTSTSESASFGVCSFDGDAFTLESLISGPKCAMRSDTLQAAVIINGQVVFLQNSWSSPLTEDIEVLLCDRYDSSNDRCTGACTYRVPCDVLSTSSSFDQEYEYGK